MKVHPFNRPVDGALGAPIFLHVGPEDSNISLFGWLELCAPRDMPTTGPEKAQEEPSGAGFGVGEEVLVSAAGTEPGLELQVNFEVRPYLTGLRSKLALGRQ